MRVHQTLSTWLIVYHLHKPINNNKNQIVTDALTIGTQQLQVWCFFLIRNPRIFLILKCLFSSILIILRNVGQALVMHNSLSLTLFQPSNFSALVLGLDIFFQNTSLELKQQNEDMHNKFSSCLNTKVSGVYSKAEVAEENVHYADKNLV